MPRKSKRTDSPNTLTQKTLDRFLGSSSPSTSRTTLPQPSPTTRRRATKKRVDSSLLPIERSKEDDDGSDSSNVGAIHFEPELRDTSDEGSPRRAPTKKRRILRAVSDDGSPVPPSNQEETIGVEVVWKGRRPGAKRNQILDDEEEEEVQPKRRKLVKGIRPPSPEYEEPDLMDEVDEDKIIDKRLRTRNKKSKFQKNLEKLRKKKRGEAVQLKLESSDSDDEEDEMVPFVGAKQDVAGASHSSHSSHDDESDAENEDPFIVEDDDAVVAELPTEFSMNTFQDLIHHFKIICQLFVHLAVQEESHRGLAMEQLLEQRYFSVPLLVIRRKLTGMRDQLVASSVWRPSFKKALETYPTFELTQLDFAEQGCDACHLGGRLSTVEGQLSGSPYDETNYESLETHDTHEAEPSNGEEDREIKKRFHFGRFCARRTRVYHLFSHWEYHLYTSLQFEVNTLRNGAAGRGFVRVAYEKQPPDDLTDADGIMDWLDERGIINGEWQKIKQMMESARHLEMRKGEDVD
ncbi:Uncharacterized protein C17H9.06c [Grifola frondosa]|uniref:Uncharacterized protein C17H9.06c n=1 Tax=Grifola frondosa TaxID=5627 RepID=A0A1C7MFH7_GRIFR|nr:Uncharacterized protein C17H9.06c [Grifola frondosa]